MFLTSSSYQFMPVYASLTGHNPPPEYVNFPNLGSSASNCLLSFPSRQSILQRGVPHYLCLYEVATVAIFTLNLESKVMSLVQYSTH